MNCDHRPWADEISDLTAEVLEYFGRRAMARVDEQIESKTAALGWTPKAADVNGWKEPKDMAILPHHEDASMFTRGVIHHPLSGRPEFKGLVDGPDGPMARIEDGDLTLTIDDLPTLLRWRDVMELAAVQLGMGLERKANRAKEAGA